MSRNANRQIVLAARPEGAPKNSNFKLIETPVPEPGDGELVTRTIYLSLDPYMRGRMNAAKSYAKPVEIGEVMTGGAVGQVIASKNPKFIEGDIVFGYSGWQDYARPERWQGVPQTRSRTGSRFNVARHSRNAGHDGLYGSL